MPSMATFRVAAALLAFASLSSAFVANNFLDQITAAQEMRTFDSVSHTDMTRNGILRAVADLLVSNPNPDVASALDGLVEPYTESDLLTAYFGNANADRDSLFEDAIVSVENSNMATDFGPESRLAAAHFDAEQFSAGQERLVYLRRQMLQVTVEGRYDEARMFLGRLLHALQDFYSHSNWVELGETTPNPDLGVPGRLHRTVAPLDMATCSDCNITGPISDSLAAIIDRNFGRHADNLYACSNNILPEVISKGYLTSGYSNGTMDTNGNVIAKPCGKCSHGGAVDPSGDVSAKGGINKDFLSVLFAALPQLHFQAAAIATEGTVQFLQSVRTEINDDFSFANLFNIQLPGSPREEVFTSIAYVIDTTASMSDVLPEIRAALPQILTELIEYLRDLGGRAAGKYILVPYNDPDPGTVFVTNNATKFTAAIGDLSATGASDCSEPTFGAIVRALQQSLPRSSIFVFTDAPASDESRFAEAQALVTKKDIRVNFILTPGCARRRRSIRDRRTSGRDLYRFLATFSGGQVLNVPVNEVASLSRLVGTSAQRVRSVLFHAISTTNTNFGFNSTLDVDSTVKEALIIASGGSLTVDLFTPSGNDASSLSAGYRVDLKTSSLYIASLNASLVAEYGQWFLSVVSAGGYDVRVIGLGGVDFETKIYRPDPSSTFGYSIIDGKPIEQEKLYFVFTSSGSFPDTILTSATVSNIETGSTLLVNLTTLTRNLTTLSGNVTSLSIGSRQYSSEIESLNAGTYRIQLNGNDGGGNDLTRVISIAVHVSSLDLALGSGQYDFLTLSRGQQRTIPLTVTNHGPETLVVLAVLSSGENSEFSYNVSPTNVAVAKDATSEVTLTVQAPLSIAGNVTVSVKLTVTAVASDSTNRNDFVAVDVFASNIEPPTPPGTIEYPPCTVDGSARVASVPSFLLLITAMIVVARI